VTTSHGWRITYVIAGVALLLVCLPLTWIFVKPHRPEHYGLLPDGESPVKQAKTVGSRITEKALDSKLPEFTLKQTIKTPTYWIYIAVGCLGMFMSPMLYVHLVPFLTDRGIGLVQAASMMGIMNTISIPTRLVIGYAIDRVKTMNMRFIFTLGLVLQLAGVVLFLIFQNTFSIYLWLIFWGIGSGTNQSVSLPLLARFFGRKSYGVTKGLVNTIAVPFAILGPIYIGWIFDSTGTYMSFIILMTILLAFAGIISFFLIPPELPSRISEIGEVEN
jgi:cyanate permease